MSSMLSSMPLTFTENLGQWNERGLYKAEAGGAAFWCCDNEVVYVFTRDTDEMIENDRLSRPQELLTKTRPFNKPLYKKEFHIIKAQFVNANPDIIA